MVPDLAGLTDWLAAQEAAVPGIRPDCAKRIDWAGPSGQQTPLALVYVHGFSATGRELSPVPERVAAQLGANLFATRLTGHGQDGAAMARARLADWRADVEEALAIGAVLGRRVLVMGCSTGCTLLTLALAEGAQAAGVVMVSPNFGLRSRWDQLRLDLPGVSIWGPWVTAREQVFEVVSPDHVAYWTTRYPTKAVMPMGAALRAARRVDPGRITVPALFAFADTDQIVNPARTRAVLARWGGPVTVHPVVPGPGDDANAHVIAGDAFSPGGTAPLVAAICDWAGQAGFAG